MLYHVCTRVQPVEPGKPGIFVCLNLSFHLSLCDHIIYVLCLLRCMGWWPETSK